MTKNSYNIWVNHRRDGKTSFAEYINGKRRNFAEGRIDDQTTAEAVATAITNWQAHNVGRKLRWQGDKLPQSFLDRLRVLTPLNTWVVD